MALHTASHWAFAAAIPSLLGGLERRHFVDTLSQLRLGTEDAANEIVSPSGKKVPAEVSTFVSVLTGNFFEDMLSDLEDGSKRIKGALPRIPSRSAERFLTLLKDNFSLAAEPAEVVVVGPVIDTVSNGTIDAVQTVMRVYHPRG